MIDKLKGDLTYILSCKNGYTSIAAKLILSSTYNLVR